MIDSLKTAGAIVLGTVVGSLPYVMYATGGAHGIEAHADHRARLGGQLAMAGDHHLELVRKRARFHVYVSNAWRVPVDAVAGTARFDGSTPVAMRRERFSLSAPARPAAREVTCAVQLADGTRVASTFVLSDEP